MPAGHPVNAGTKPEFSKILLSKAAVVSRLLPGEVPEPICNENAPFVALRSFAKCFSLYKRQIALLSKISILKLTWLFVIAVPLGLNRPPLIFKFAGPCCANEDKERPARPSMAIYKIAL